MAEMIALLPRLSSKIGHIFHYHLAVQKSLALISWEYTVLIPQKAEVSPLPPGWYPTLANDLSEAPKGLWALGKILFENIEPFRKSIQKIESKNSAILFIEHFELQHLMSIALALFFLRPKFQFWMLHRYEFGAKRWKCFFCRMFLWYMEKRLGKAHVKCLTDSELLAKELEKDLGRPIVVVPIPHTDGAIEREGRRKEIQFWWPGGLIRQDKGLLTIRRLLDLIEHRAVQLVMAEKAKEVFAPSPHVYFIPTLLSREEYVRWMQRVDLVLLPYAGKDYSCRTSGIFVEAISLGATPVTTKGTWMAYELEKFHLEELIFDWEEPDLLDRLLRLLTNGAVQSKLEIMCSVYRQFHSLEGFSRVMQELTTHS